MFYSSILFWKVVLDCMAIDFYIVCMWIYLWNSMPKNGTQKAWSFTKKEFKRIWTIICCCCWWDTDSFYLMRKLSEGIEIINLGFYVSRICIIMKYTYIEPLTYLIYPLGWILSIMYLLYLGQQMHSAANSNIAVQLKFHWESICITIWILELLIWALAFRGIHFKTQQKQETR